MLSPPSFLVHHHSFSSSSPFLSTIMLSPSSSKLVAVDRVVGRHCEHDTVVHDPELLLVEEILKQPSKPSSSSSSHFCRSLVVAGWRMQAPCSTRNLTMPRLLQEAAQCPMASSRQILGVDVAAKLDEELDNVQVPGAMA